MEELISYCKDKPAHKMYHAIGQPCGCMAMWIPEEVARRHHNGEKCTPDFVSNAASILKAAPHHLMWLVLTNVATEENHQNDICRNLMAELGDDTTLYNRSLAVNDPTSARRAGIPPAPQEEINKIEQIKKTMDLVRDYDPSQVSSHEWVLSSCGTISRKGQTFYKKKKKNWK